MYCKRYDDKFRLDRSTLRYKKELQIKINIENFFKVFHRLLD